MLERDRNLLFGVFAVQLGKVTPAQLVEAAAAWATDPVRTLPQRLVADGAMTGRDCNLIEDLVAQAVRAHEGDAAATLAEFGGVAEVQRLFADSILLTPDGGIAPSPRGIDAADRIPGVKEEPGRYREVRVHAKGGMGRILLAFDQHLEREVVLKELLDQNPNQAEADDAARHYREADFDRFVQEARITGQLEHPSIVPVHEIGYREDGTIYYTMKRVRGRTMGEAIRQTRDLTERLALLPNYLNLCQAIAFAHSRGVIHRDLKPSNVMIGEFGETVVIDWGLAKFVGRADVHADGLAETLKLMRDAADVSGTFYGQVLGTPSYMSPEQAQGALDQVDFRSDVYSLGAVLYELLTGCAPYSGANPYEVIMRVVRDSPKPIIAIEPQAPRELIAICERAMSKDRPLRYQSGGEIAEDIQRFLSGALVQAYQYGFLEHLKRFIGRNRVLVTAALAGVILLVGIGAYSFRLSQFRQNERRQMETARRATYNSTLLLAANYLERRQFDDAYDLLWTAPENERDWEWGYLLRLCRQALVTLPTHPDKVLNAIYSPDGGRIVTWNGQVEIWDAQSGNRLVSIQGPAAEVHCGAFSADGRLLFTAGVQAKVWRTDSGKLLSELAVGPEDVLTAAFCPDGRYVLTVGTDRTAKVWRSESGECVLRIEDCGGSARPEMFSPSANLLITPHRDGLARVWETDSGALRAELTGHTRELTCAGFDPRGELAVTASADNTARVWRVADGGMRHVLRNAAEVHALAFHPNLGRLVTVSRDNIIRMWDLDTGIELAVSENLAQRVHDSAFTNDGSRVILTLEDRSALVGNPITDDRWMMLAGHVEGVLTSSVSRRGNRIVTVTTSGMVQIWGPSDPAIVSDSGIDLFMSNASGGSDRSRIVRSSRPNIVTIERAGDGHPTLIIDGSDSVVAFGPNESRILAGNAKGFLTLYSAREGTPIWSIRAHREAVRCAAFSPDGAQIATGSQDKTVRVWEAASGREVSRLIGHADAVTSVAFSAIGNRVVSSSWDGWIKVWDPKNGVALFSLPYKPEATPQAAFAPDGRSVIAVRTHDSIFQWRAHPYRADDLPGDTVDDWRSRFERWWQNLTPLP